MLRCARFLRSASGLWRIAFAAVALGVDKLAIHIFELRVLVHAPIVDDRAGHRGMVKARVVHHHFR